MKKFTVWTLAALMVVAFALPAWSLETQFGGYWRTRMFTQQNFSGEDESETKDLSRVDTRTRLYFTTIFNENLKFVNKFEFDAVWGDDTLGDIGADGKSFEIKNSYADFNLGAVNAKVGIQGYAMGRSFLFDDDFSGAVVSYESDAMSLPFIWIKAHEGGMGKDANEMDLDMVGFNPSFNIGNLCINPFGLYVYSEAPDAFGNAGKYYTDPYGMAGQALDEVNMWFAGLNFDADFDAVSFWLTGIYQGGDVDLTNGNSADFKAWLGAAGAKVNMGFGDIHGEFFYATGDDDMADEDMERFWMPAGQSYYWAEIMGLGMFDNQTSNNATGDQISNIMAANLGVTIKPVDKMSVTLDAWYAALAEDINVNGQDENYLGTELDLIITYELVEGLTLDVVGAYLFAGEATTLDDSNEADPYEIGTRLQLKF